MVALFQYKPEVRDNQSGVVLPSPGFFTEELAAPKIKIGSQNSFDVI